MRSLLVSLLATLTLALPAGAAVDPRVLVLGQSNVPHGYELDENNSQLLTRAMVDQVSGNDEGAHALARAGFVNGYSARYTNYGPPHWRNVNSAGFVFRQAEGARWYLRWLMRAGLARSGVSLQRIRLGDEGSLLVSTSPRTGTAVVWRYHRVVAWLTCTDMARHRSLALTLSKRQQRRIVAASG